MNDYYVYGYSDPNSCDCFFYIGKGKGNRAYDHLNVCYRDQTIPFYKKLKALLDRGIKPEIEILVNGLTEEEAHQHEIYYIRQYGRRSDGGILLNLTSGGEGVTTYGHKHTEETKRIMSLKQKGRVKSEQHRLNLCKPKSEEGRLNMCQPKTLAHRLSLLKLKEKPFARCSFGGRIEQIFRNQVDAIKYGYTRNGIANVLHGRQKSHKDYFWRYLTEQEIQDLLK